MAHLYFFDVDDPFSLSSQYWAADDLAMQEARIFAAIVLT